MLAGMAVAVDCILLLVFCLFVVFFVVFCLFVFVCLFCLFFFLRGGGGGGGFNFADLIRFSLYAYNFLENILGLLFVVF